MLFLYRPRQTWMPYRSPRGYTDQSVYNRRMQERFDATRRVPPQGQSAPQAVALSILFLALGVLGSLPGGLLYLTGPAPPKPPGGEGGRSEQAPTQVRLSWPDNAQASRREAEGFDA